MARKIEESVNTEIILLFKGGHRVVNICKKLKVSNGYVYKLLQKAGLKRTLKEQGLSTWNKGKTKYTDERISNYAKKKSKDFIYRGKYKKVWSDELKRHVWEHHYVWFKKNGYWPNTKNGEQVHHIDGDTLNNNISNLFLTDVKTHIEIHKNYESVCFELIKHGLLKINKKTGMVDRKSLCKIIKKLKA